MKSHSASQRSDTCDSSLAKEADIAKDHPEGPHGEIFIGCAGWTIPSQHAALFPPGGSHLARYQRQFNAVEINTSFYRSHRPATYRRWASESPSGFRFSVKVPRTITHEHRLGDAQEAVAAFLAEVRELGDRLGPLLFQLPPSLRFQREKASLFFESLREQFGGQVVLEPRHLSWLAREAMELLIRHEIAVAAADPPLGGMIEPSGASCPVYYRLHGQPQTYYSPYGEEDLRQIANQMCRYAELNRSVWCIFDNTAAGAAQVDALSMQQLTRDIAGLPSR